MSAVSREELTEDTSCALKDSRCSTFVVNDLKSCSIPGRIFLSKSSKKLIAVDADGVVSDSASVINYLMDLRKICSCFS